MIDKPTYDRILKEVPTFRLISQSILIERLKVNGSLARVAIRHLEKEGAIKRIVHHHGQLIYSTFFSSAYERFIHIIIAFQLARQPARIRVANLLFLYAFMLVSAHVFTSALQNHALNGTNPGIALIYVCSSHQISNQAPGSATCKSTTR